MFYIKLWICINFVFYSLPQHPLLHFVSPPPPFTTLCITPPLYYTLFPPPPPFPPSHYQIIISDVSLFMKIMFDSYFIDSISRLISTV